MVKLREEAHSKFSSIAMDDFLIMEVSLSEAIGT